jgi:hypothetical protein
MEGIGMRSNNFVAVTLFLWIAVVLSDQTCLSFQLGKIFSVPTLGNNPAAQVQVAKKELLEALSNTSNGKDSTLENQIKVLGLIGYLEANAPVSKTLLTDATEAKAIDGDWYLQYTQPSKPEGIESESDIKLWTPTESTLDKTKRVDRKQVQNEGSVSFLGLIKVDTAKKLTIQSIGFEDQTFSNSVEQNFGTIRVEGSFELDAVPNRILATFKNGSLTLKNGFVIDFSVLFALRALLKKDTPGGWLETTYIDEDMRVARGNRGSLFVLSRDKDLVTP